MISTDSNSSGVLFPVDDVSNLDDMILYVEPRVQSELPDILEAFKLAV